MTFAVLATHLVSGRHSSQGEARSAIEPTLSSHAPSESVALAATRYKKKSLRVGKFGCFDKRGVQGRQPPALSLSNFTFLDKRGVQAAAPRSFFLSKSFFPI